MKWYFCRLPINFSSFIGVDWLESGCPAISPFFIPQICTHATCAFCKYVHMQLATFCTHWHTQILHKTAMFVGNRQLVVDWRVCFCEDSFVTETSTLVQGGQKPTYYTSPSTFTLMASVLTSFLSLPGQRTKHPHPCSMLPIWLKDGNISTVTFSFSEYYGYVSIFGELFDIWSFNIWHFHSKLNLSWIAFFHHHPPHNHHHSNISCKTFNEVLRGIWSTGALWHLFQNPHFLDLVPTQVSQMTHGTEAFG